MKSFIFFLAFAATVSAAPFKHHAAPTPPPKAAAAPVEMPLPVAIPPAPAPAIEETISKADILKTLDHMGEIVDHQKKQLDAANATIATQGIKLDGAIVALKGASDGLAEVKKAFDDMKSERDKAVEHDAKVTKLSEQFATAIGIQLALIVLLVCLKFGVWSMSPPAGAIATCVLPLLALGVIKLLPHIP